MKKSLLVILFSIFNSLLSAITIYRPFNNEDINSVPCYLRILDENNTDVTYTYANASYSWYDHPKYFYYYKNKFYLYGGQIMHLKIKPGKYKIEFYTPKDKTYPFQYLKKTEWKSNSYYYDTESDLVILYVSPTADDNYLYNGGWYIDHKTPKFFYYTVPKYYDFN
ncbi:MAG: hypothetical protein MJ174_08455 [Treponema sp.]|nr:hypothetical protein [Treponema sp.]